MPDISLERENLIRKLLEENHTYKEIIDIVHCSPNVIPLVKRKITGEHIKTNNGMKSKSLCSQALDQLLKGVSLIQVTINLDLEPEQAKKYYDIFLDLTKREKIVSLLGEGQDLDLNIKILTYLLKNPPEVKRIEENEKSHIEVWVDPPGGKN